MAALIRVFLDLALLRCGPQVLPTSALLVGCATLAYLASNALVTAFVAADAPHLLVDVALDLALDCVGLWLILALARRLARFPQSLAAVLGTGALLNVALLPGLALARVGPTALVPLGALAVYAVLGWSLAVLANIFRHALEVKYPAALLVALGYVFAGIGAYRALGAD